MSRANRPWIRLAALCAAVVCVASSVSAQTKLTVELGDVSLTKLPFIVAADTGIYERNGLTVSQFITPSAAEAVKRSGVEVPPQYIKSGVVGDINIGGGSPTMVRMTSSAVAPERIILATTDNVSRFHILSRADIATVEDLKGKRIGYGSLGALDHYAEMSLFLKLGWDPVHDVSMFANGNGYQYVLKGRVDAFAGTDVAIDESKKHGLKDLVDLSPYNFVMPGSGVNALRDWLTNNHDAAARFIKATVEAIAVVKKDKQTTFASMRKWYGVTEPDKLEAFYREASKLPSKPYPSVEGLERMRQIYNWREMEIHPASYFYDASFVAELDKSGYIDGLYKTAAK
jgi:NitT/TauT family transport system substrate-binding protein